MPPKKKSAKKAVKKRVKPAGKDLTISFDPKTHTTTLVSWGYEMHGEGLFGIQQVTPIDNGFIALMDNGTVCIRQLGHHWDPRMRHSIYYPASAQAPENHRDLVQVENRYGLKADGSIVCLIGGEDEGFINPENNLPPIKKLLCASWGILFAITENGHLVGWNEDEDDKDENQVIIDKIPTGLKGVRKIFLEYRGVCCALTEDGMLHFWGDPSISFDAFEHLKKAIEPHQGRIADFLLIGRDSKYLILLDCDGQIITLRQYPEFEPQKIHVITLPDFDGKVSIIEALDPDYLFFYAVTETGRIYACGSNEWADDTMEAPAWAGGLLSLKSNKRSFLGVKIVSLEEADEWRSTAGRLTSLGDSGEVIAWGGDDDRSICVNLGNAVAIECDDESSGVLLLRNDQTLSEIYVQYAPNQNCAPAWLGNDFSAISRGEDHNLVLKNNGRVVCWGENKKFQCMPPDDLEYAVEICASGNHSYALDSSGKVYVWGGHETRYSTYTKKYLKEGARDKKRQEKAIGSLPSCESITLIGNTVCFKCADDQLYSDRQCIEGKSGYHGYFLDSKNHLNAGGVGSIEDEWKEKSGYHLLGKKVPLTSFFTGYELSIALDKKGKIYVRCDDKDKKDRFEQIPSEVQEVKAVALGGGSHWPVCFAICGKTSGFKRWIEISKTESAAKQIKRYKEINPRGKWTSGETKSACYTLCRGHALLNNAVNWVDPKAGQSGPSAIVRGLQWRLVMAYAGLEILIKTVQHGQPITPAGLKELLNRLETPAIEPIAPPKPKKAAFEKWLKGDGATEKALDFLGVEKGDRNVVKEWFIGQKPIEDWVNAVLLAKAFRNMCAHASLSANKCSEFGFERPMAEIPDHLNKLAEAIFEQLAS